MKFFYYRNDFKSGFSLIELVVVLGLMSIAGMAFIGFYGTALKANKSNELRTDLEDIKRTIINKASSAEFVGPFRSR